MLKTTLLTGFVAISVFVGTASAEDIPVAPDQAAVVAVETLAQSGLAQPKTVWVPARYRDDNKSAFFLAGNQFAAPGGFTDVVGFLPREEGGYLVAVRQSAQPASLPSLADAKGPFVVFYAVGQDGSIEKIFGSIPSDSQTVVGKNAIFVDSSKTSGMYAYSGYDTKGKLLTGPQGVRFASPSPDGGWFIQKVVSSDSIETQVVLMHQAENGTTKVISKSKIDNKDVSFFQNTTAAAVDVPPYTDSVRTGFVGHVFKRYKATTSDFQEWLAALTNLAAEKAVVGKWYVTVGSQHNVPMSHAVEMTRRMIVLGSVEKPIGAGQIQPGGFKGVQYGITDLSAEVRAFDSEKPLFEIYGGGANFFRQALGGSNSVGHSHNDAYAIVTPTSNVLVFANEVGRDKPWQAVNINSGAKVSPEEIEGFLYQYGMTK